VLFEIAKDEARDPLPSCFETPRVRAAPQHEGGRGYASRARGGRSLFSPVIYRENSSPRVMRGQKRVEDARERAYHPRIHLLLREKVFTKRMDCRVKPGNDRVDGLRRTPLQIQPAGVPK